MLLKREGFYRKVSLCQNSASLDSSVNLKLAYIGHSLYIAHAESKKRDFTFLGSLSSRALTGLLVQLDPYQRRVSWLLFSLVENVAQ